MYNGHYMTVAKCPNNNVHLFDDSSVSSQMYVKYSVNVEILYCHAYFFLPGIPFLF